MRAILGAIVALLIASTATAQTTIEQRNQWRRQAAQFEAAAAGLRLAARCDMPDFPSGWTYRKEVTPTAAPGSTLTNIPVAVTITADSDISANALANGHDILFTSLTDGTTVYPSWRASYSAGTWKGFVLFPSFSSGDKCYVNYGNADASDQSTTAALTGGGMTHWLNFQSADTSQLVDVISGATAATTGTVNTAGGPLWDAWLFQAGASATFGAGEIQPPLPYTRVSRTRAANLTRTWPYKYGVAFPVLRMDFFTWRTTLASGSSGLASWALVPDVWTTVSGSAPDGGGVGAVYAQGALINGSLAIGSPVYDGALLVASNGYYADIAELGYFSGTKDANWHAFWHANTGAVSLSEQEEAVTAPPLSINGMCPVIRCSKPSATVSIRKPEASVRSRVLGASVIPGCN